MPPKEPKERSTKQYKVVTVRVRVPALDGPHLQWENQSLKEKLNTLADKASKDAKEQFKEMKARETNLLA